MSLRRRVKLLRDMDNYYQTSNGTGPTENGHMVRHSPYQPCTKASVPWLCLRVFYVRVSKCEIDDSTPEYLSLNHIPLNPDTLLEVNGVRTNMPSDGVSTLLRRDRLDKKFEEATFVTTDSIKMTGSAKFEVFDKDIRLLSGVLELCNSNGFLKQSNNHGQSWSINCESDITPGTGFLKGKQFVVPEVASPTIEVYVAGSFSDTPIFLTHTLQLNCLNKQMRKGIPESEATQYNKDVSLGRITPISEYTYHKAQDEGYNNPYSETEYLEGEDGELSWFNAGVRVGVGIGLSVCLGIGIGVGLLVRTYQGTTRTFKKRLL